MARRLSSCGSQALELRLSSGGAWAGLLRGMWDLPGPGIEPVSPALAGGFLTTVPPGKPRTSHYYGLISSGKALSLFPPPALPPFLPSFPNTLVNSYTSFKAQLLESLSQHQFQLLMWQTTMPMGEDLGVNRRENAKVPYGSNVGDCTGAASPVSTCVPTTLASRLFALSVWPTWLTEAA